MAYWLLKSEPDVYSIDDLARDGVACWEGVRNYAARNNLQAMKLRDKALFYHSNADPPGVAGICEVVKRAYPDHHAWDPSSRYYDPKSDPDKPRWFMPDVRFVEKFPRLVPLSEVRATRGLKDMELLRFGRLSVQRVTAGQWRIINRLARTERA